MSRTEHYLARLQARLPVLRDDAARRAFILREIESWEERYALFAATAGQSLRSGDAAGQPMAFDFVDTLAALGAAHARLSRDG